MIIFLYQVKEVIKLLWENEAPLCSFINDIQQRSPGTKAGHLMFFLDKILVPPIKFRPPSKGGDSVSSFMDKLSYYICGNYNQ